MFDHYTTMDESDFYEHLESLNADSVQNQDPVDAKNSVERLVSRLQNAGLKVETATGPESEEFYVFQTGNAEETKHANASILLRHLLSCRRWWDRCP